MNDKSPRQQLSKKPGKSIKQKRADKRSKETGAETPLQATRRKDGRS